MFTKFLSQLFRKNTPASILAGKTILVIDDGELERKMLSATLGKLGCRVLTAFNGEFGLSTAVDQKPDLIILDYLMPGLNGREVCERLKADVMTKDIPVIFLTGSEAPKHVVECYDVGAEHFLTKPISSQALVLQVEAVFASKQGK